MAERLIRKEGVDKATETIVERLKRDWQYAPNPSGMNELLTIGRTEQTLFTIDGQVYSGETDRIRSQVEKKLCESIRRHRNGRHTREKNYRYACEVFSKVPVKPGKKKRVGITGEIYMKYSKLGNDDIESFLLRQGMEMTYSI